tara:strand:- start:659 stop:2062 length:1404 start_codon:yes stop_codon:yes gene_type:complete
MHDLLCADQDSVQMLQRSSQVGEFYRMMPPAVWNASKLLPGQYMDLLIYDEETDQLKHIDFEQALHATGVVNVGSVTSLMGFANERELKDAINTQAGVAPGGNPWLNANDGLTANSTSEDRAEAAADVAFEALSVANTPAGVATIIAAVKAGIWMPLCITICRPFMEHLMMSCVATVSGRDTGATLFGPADMQISANTSVKTIEGHYTCHTKSVITKPQNVYVMRDIMCSGYVAGGNCTFFGLPYGRSTFERGVPATSADIQRTLNERLSFADDATGEYASMLAFLSGYKSEIASQRDQVISISDRLLPWEVSKNADPEKKYFPGGAAGFRAYSQAWNLGQVHFGEDVRATENMAFMSQGAVNNSLAFIGPHRKYNPFAQNFFELVPGQGHFGPDAIPGVRAAPIPTLSSLLPYAHTNHDLNDASRGRTRGGGGGRACRSRRRATAWCRSRWRRTRSWRCARPTASE